MHFQPGQAELVRCVRGSILDVVVDIRRRSFGQWESAPAPCHRQAIYAKLESIHPLAVAD